MNRKGFLEVTGAALGFLCVCVVLVAIALNPAVTKPFQEERALAICEFDGEQNCEAKIADMSEEEILVYIRDDSPDGTGFYSQAHLDGNGGNFDDGYMN